MQEAHQDSAPRRKSASTPTKARANAAAAAQQQAFQQYQSALLLMQEGKFEKARAVFNKIAADGPPELLERSRVYITVCDRNAKSAGLTFGNSEEQYDYAVSLLNTGYYEEAREQFEEIVKRSPGADYAYYGLAILESMTGHAEDCLINLSRAIELKPHNRIQARSDSDFQDMSDDPRFTELLYPE
jgi:tetratricopeptide (TPR) repeat protein